jgi:ADP-ribose pyrophosphatase
VPMNESDSYERLRQERPRLFDNPPGAAFEIIPVAEAKPEHGPYGVQYQDPYIMLVRDPVRFLDGNVGGYFRVMPRAEEAGAAILPIMDGRVVLVRHFRHATRRWHWEIPRGFSDPGESPEQTARRELTEELGVTAQRLGRLGVSHVDTGTSSGSTTLYWASVLALIPHDALGEGIFEHKAFNGGELDALLESGDLTDSFTLAAMLHARRLGLLD